MIVCDAFGHLYTTDDIRALYNFATGALRLKPEWNHASRWFPHWDLTTERKRKLAWHHGAFEPTSHRENADLIKQAEVYAKTLGEALTSNLYKSTGLVGQPICRVNYSAMFAALDSKERRLLGLEEKP